MAGSWIDHVLWSTHLPDLTLNPDAGIYRFWREQRRQGIYLGVPVTPEVQTPVGVQQGFSSGAVINWGADGGSLAHG